VARAQVRSVVGAARVYFVLVFGAGFILGSVRVPLLVPRIGERAAELAEMPLMLAVMVFSAGYLVRSHEDIRSGGAWLVVGVAALTLLVLAELLLAVALAGRGVGEYIASRDPVSGSVYLAMLALYAVMPGLQYGWRARPDGGSMPPGSSSRGQPSGSFRPGR
jgi:hypothetical protein